MQPLILRVDIGGQPMGWAPWQEAAVLHVKEQIALTVGATPFAQFLGRSGCLDECCDRLCGLEPAKEWAYP